MHESLTSHLQRRVIRLIGADYNERYTERVIHKRQRKAPKATLLHEPRNNTYVGTQASSVLVNVTRVDPAADGDKRGRVPRAIVAYVCILRTNGPLNSSTFPHKEMPAEYRRTTTDIFGQPVRTGSSLLATVHRCVCRCRRLIGSNNRLIVMR